MFNSPGQRAAVCETLCLWNDWPSLWSSTGPSERTQGIVEGRIAALAPEEQALAPLVWALWREEAELIVNLQKLRGPMLLCVGSLLEALALNGDALDQWLEEHSADGLEFESSLRMTGTL